MKSKHLVKILVNDGIPFESQKIGRNSFCSCGSGKKAKKCCGTETKYRFNSKAFQKKEQSRIKEKRVDLTKLLIED